MNGRILLRLFFSEPRAATCSRTADKKKGRTSRPEKFLGEDA
jgi:hypothetical protein